MTVKHAGEISSLHLMSEKECISFLVEKKIFSDEGKSASFLSLGLFYARSVLGACTELCDAAYLFDLGSEDSSPA